MPQIDPAHVKWCQNLFRLMSEGGTWGIPRSGLTFQKRASELILIDRMPWQSGMELSHSFWEAYQQDDFELQQTYFGQAGIPVRDETKKG